MNPSRSNFFMKKLTRDRVVPTISASVSWEIGRDGPHRSVVLAVPREQQQLSRQPFLAGAEELVDEVFLDADGARQQVRDEHVRHRVLLVQQAHHLVWSTTRMAVPRRRGRALHADGLPRQASFAKEVAGAQHRHDRLSPGLREHRDLHTTRSGCTGRCHRDRLA